MKKLPFYRFIQIILLAATATMLFAFFILTERHNLRKDSTEKALSSAIDSAVELCNSYESRINIDENLRDDLNIYIADINNATSLQRKAYYTHIMLTYTQNRVNMNNPQTLLELAHELGNEYVTDGAEIAAYKSYIEDIATTMDTFEAAWKDYSSFGSNPASDAIAVSATRSAD